MANLTRTQLGGLKQTLDNRQSLLRDDVHRELLAADEQGFADLAGQVHDSGEESVADLLADLNITLIERQVQELRRVEDALRRMSMGSYGLCSNCGNNIEYDRLRSYPTAGRCIECQNLYEHTFAHEGTPRL